MLNEILLLLALIVFILYKGRTKLPKNLPPGPLRLPGIGNLLQMAASKKRTPYDVFHELSEKYGPIIFLQLGVTYQVVLEDFSIIKEVLTDDLWVERHYSEWMAQRSYGKILGVLMVSGDVWKEMRRFSVRTLRDFGFGKQKSMELGLEEELRDLISKMETNYYQGTSSVVPMKQFFTVSVLNILWSMIAGFRFCHEDAKLRELITIIENEARSNAIGSLTSPLYLYTAFPFLAKVVPLFSSVDAVHRENTSRIQNFLKEILEERRADGFYLHDQRDYIDVFLREIDAHKEEHPEMNKYTDEQFIVVTMDLFMAGSETTSNTIEFAILYLMQNPEVRDKVQAEIDSVVGRSRLPCISDKPKMPFTEATILEVQRHANVVPIDVRAPVRDTTLRGYTIPAKTAAVINLHAMHMDEKAWGDPHAFRPQRFLNSDLTQVINADRILPFGAGKRICLGEQLAKATLFTFITSMLQRFTFEEDKGFPLPSSEPMMGFTLAPQPYHAKIKPRHQK